MVRWFWSKEDMKAKCNQRYSILSFIATMEPAANKKLGRRLEPYLQALGPRELVHCSGMDIVDLETFECESRLF